MSIASRFLCAKGETCIYVGNNHRISKFTIPDFPPEKRLICQFYYTYDLAYRPCWEPLTNTRKILEVDANGNLNFCVFLGLVESEMMLTSNVFVCALPHPKTSSSKIGLMKPMVVLPRLLFCLSSENFGDGSSMLSLEYRFRLYHDWVELCIAEGTEIFDSIAQGRQTIPRHALIHFMETRWRQIVGSVPPPNLMQDIFGWCAFHIHDRVIPDFIDYNIFVSSHRSKLPVWIAFNSVIELYCRIPLIQWLINRGEFFHHRDRTIFPTDGDEKYFMFRLALSVLQYPVLVLDIFQREQIDEDDGTVKYVKITPSPYVSLDSMQDKDVIPAFVALKSVHDDFHREMKLEDMHIIDNGRCRRVTSREIEEIKNVKPIGGSYLSSYK